VGEASPEAQRRVTLTWGLRRLQRPDADGDGYLALDFGDFHAFEEAERGWQEKHGGKIIISIGE
jgi:hypothetical protein